jgi:hypothetical protein
LLPILAQRGGSLQITPQGLYATSELSIDAADNAEAESIARLQAVGLNHAGHPVHNHLQLVTAAQAIRTALENDGLATRDPTDNDDETRFLIARGATAAPLLVALLANVEWLYPDDPRLWRHLAAAASVGAHPLIIARHVAPITFPLLATFNARAVQFYELLIAAVCDTTEAEANALGLPRIRLSSTQPEHPVMGQIRRLVAKRPTGQWAPDAPTAFDDAIALGFGTVESDPSRLVTWAETHAELPTQWVTGLRLWSTGKSPHRPSGHKRSPPPETAAGPEYGRKTVKSRVSHSGCKLANVWHTQPKTHTTAVSFP